MSKHNTDDELIGRIKDALRKLSSACDTLTESSYAYAHLSVVSSDFQLGLSQLRNCEGLDDTTRQVVITALGKGNEVCDEFKLAFLGHEVSDLLSELEGETA